MSGPFHLVYSAIDSCLYATLSSHLHDAQPSTQGTMTSGVAQVPFDKPSLLTTVNTVLDGAADHIYFRTGISVNNKK
jgi:hypothetical protein